jgi:hypothetical protein
VCHHRRRRVGAKSRKTSDRRRKIEGDEQKDCREIAADPESILAFFR